VLGPFGAHFYTGGVGAALDSGIRWLSSRVLDCRGRTEHNCNRSDRGGSKKWQAVGCQGRARPTNPLRQAIIALGSAGDSHYGYHGGQPRCSGKVKPSIRLRSYKSTPCAPADCRHLRRPDNNLRCSCADQTTGELSCPNSVWKASRYQSTGTARGPTKISRIRSVSEGLS